MKQGLDGAAGRAGGAVLARGGRRDRGHSGDALTLQAVIVGVGESSIGRVPGVSALELMAQAMDAALESAGLERGAIDGVITLPVLTESWMMPAAHVARGLGLAPPVSVDGGSGGGRRGGCGGSGGAGNRNRGG